MAKVLQQTGYGLSQAIQALSPNAVVAQRIPTTADFGYPLGQIWVSKPTQAAYVLVSVAGNVALWQLFAPAGAGSFTTLTSTGATTLATTGASVNTFGNTTGATSLALRAGTGNMVIDGAPSTTIAIGASLITGTISIGGTGASTGTITLGNSTAVQSIDIGAGAGAANISIGGVGANLIGVGPDQAGGVITIGESMITGTIAIGSLFAGTGDISIGVGTGAQSILIANSGTGAKTIAIGLTGSVDVINVGSTTGASLINLRAGTAGINLISGGAVKMQPATVSAAAYAATLSEQVGQVTLTGQVLASAATQVLTITNVLCLTTTPIFVTVDNLGANDAQLTVQRIKLLAGSFEVTVKNNGAAALNGDIHVNFWLLS